MTGEMSQDDLKDYPHMQALTKVIRKSGYAAQLRPFDQYQGPYIAVSFTENPGDKTVGSWNAEIWDVGTEMSEWGIEYRGKFVSTGLYRSREVIEELDRLSKRGRRDRFKIPSSSGPGVSKKKPSKAPKKMSVVYLVTPKQWETIKETGSVVITRRGEDILATRSNAMVNKKRRK